MRRALGLFLLLVLLLGGAAAGGWLYLRHWLGTPGPLAGEAVVVLPPGTGVAGIAARLTRAGAIGQPLLFQAAVRLQRRERGLKAGEYALEAGTSPAAIIDKLVRGEVLLHRIVVPEGLTAAEVADLLGASDVLAGALPPGLPEGGLLPETYLVPRGEPRAKLVERMRAGMGKLLAELWAGRAPDLPVATPGEALTLASIIEKETSVPAEYPLIASVFVNRLRRGMKLQTDPTVIYGLSGGKGTAALNRSLTTADLEQDDPYNTYRINGLPPGPIANPGRPALEAALHPAGTGYLYFVADGSGGHAFARTLEEHNRNVARWRKLKGGQRTAPPKP